MSTTAGHPVHAVTTYGTWPNGVLRYKTACGRTDHTTSGLGDSRKALRGELCRQCFPAGHGTVHPEPVRAEPGDIR